MIWPDKPTRYKNRHYHRQQSHTVVYKAASCGKQVVLDFQDTNAITNISHEILLSVKSARRHYEDALQFKKEKASKE